MPFIPQNRYNELLIAEKELEMISEYNDVDAEDCLACTVVEDMCPYHLGFEAGSKWAYALAAAEYMGLKPAEPTLTNCTCKAIPPPGYPKLPCVAHPASAGAIAPHTDPAPIREGPQLSTDVSERNS